jgi:hypothetical protein
MYYDAKKKGSAPDFSRFGTRKESFEKLCQENHRPETYLAKLLDGMPFAFEKDANGIRKVR